MKEKFESEKESLQQELDELRVQLALGRAEAINYLEEVKSDFSDFLDKMGHDLSKFGAPANNATGRLKAKLDHLRVQLQLGRMESYEAYCEQRKKITGSIDEMEKVFNALAHEGKESVAALRSSFSKRANLFQLRLEAAAVSLGAGTMLAAHEVEDTAEKANDWLANLADMTLEEIREARKYIKMRVAAHSRREDEN